MSHNLIFLQNQSQSTNNQYKLLHKKSTCKELNSEYFSLIHNQDIDPSERSLQLQDLQHRVTKLRSSTQKATLLRKIHKALINHKNIVTQFRLKELRQKDLLLSQQENNRKTLFQHFVLDSLARKFPNLVRNNGITCCTSQAFIGSMLEAFADFCKQKDSIVLLNLQKSITLAQNIELIRGNPDLTPDSQIFISKMITNRLLKMASRQLTTPLFLSAGSEEHAVALKITFSEKSQFSLTLINTGHGAIKDAETNMFTDLYFSNLTLQKLEELPWILIHSPKQYSFFLYSLKRAFNFHPVDYASSHGEQGGDSCASKILTQFLKTSMHPLLYRKFKVFMTSKLLETQSDPQLKKLGAIILQKRQLKFNRTLLEKMQRKLQAKKENQTQDDKTLRKLYSLFEELRLPYFETHTPYENTIDAKRWIYGQLSTLTETDNLKMALNTV